MARNFFGLFDNEEKPVKNSEANTLVVKKARCPQNHPCPSIKVCPTGALTQSGYASPKVDMSKCIKCGKCVNFCPMRALVLE